MVRWLTALVSRLRDWRRRDALDQDFDAELQAHLAMLAEENLRRGMLPDQALRAARVRLGGITQLKENRSEGRGLPALDTLWRDVRYAFRVLARNPGFTVVAVLTLGIGIGVNSTAFTIVNAVAFRPLPVADAGNLLRIERWFDSGARGDVQYAFSFEEYAYYRAHTKQLSSLIAVGWPESVVAGGSEGEVLQGQVVSGDYFKVLGVNAVEGRTFLADESARPVVVLANGFWHRHFHSDPGVVGTAMTLNDTSFTIIGVAPSSFIGTGNPPQAPDFWAPLMMQAQLSPAAWLHRPAIHRLQLLARLGPDGSSAQARAELQLLASQLAETPETHQPHDRTVALTLQPAVYFGGTDDLRFRAMVALVMAVVSLVLLVACANLANMLLARAASRQQEMAVRLAIGASRGRIIRQLLTESVLLGTLGGIAGIVLSVWAGGGLWTLVDGMLRAMFVTDRPFVTSTAVDGRILVFGLAVSLGASVLFGLLPAVRSSSPGIGRCLTEQGFTISGRPGASRLRAWLIVAQMAVSTVLLVCAGLLLRGLASSQGVDTGFDTDRLFMVFLDVGSDQAEGALVQKRLVDRLSLATEVQEVALLDRFPFGGTWSPPVMAENVLDPAKRPSMRTLANTVSANFFRATGIDIRWGRTFTAAEARTGAPVAVVSESAARRLWADADPLGRNLKLDQHFNGELTTFEVVGIAKDVRSANLSRIDPAYVYLPTRSDTTYNLIIRSDRNASAVLAAARDAVAAVSRKRLPTLRVINLRDGPMMRVQRLTPRLLATFAATLACLAVILAVVGVYGVTSYVMSQRTREIGIRMAIGATAGDVQRLVVRQGTGPALVGVTFGLLAAAAVSRILQNMLIAPTSPDLLFGVAPFDAATFVGMPVLMLAVAAAASYIPARRAAAVDPLVALRHG